ncbi:nadph oxidase-like protein [Dinothrombium tinctorium]|uniref:Nadph oxidase-like protein n=1 Tax=Dinothrombium tinctorium TaxID=1965070 RepID=A0A443R9I4_9ACAR|nr:nadph oxidase-like protein [Dinothrombium tinctorium]
MPGHYVFIKCSNISSIEWHPFSISSHSANGEENFSLHIRARGDWTEKLKNKIAGKLQSSKCQTLPETFQSFKFFIDGPFCSPLQDVLSYKACVCIAGGIGITPFVSVFEFLR